MMSSYKGGKEGKLTRPESLNLNSREGGGDIKLTNMVNFVINFTSKVILIFDGNVRLQICVFIIVTGSI